jgi:hypothetical protein
MLVDTIANIKFDKKSIGYLSVLKPAATAILLAPSKTNLKDIIKYTVMDLALKKVLTIQHKNIFLHPNDAYKRLRTVVETDKNFASYRTTIYETYFVGIIDEDSYFQLRTYLTRIYHELPLDNKVKKSIIKDQKIKNLFALTFTFDSFSVFWLNGHGKKIRNEIKRYFVTIERHLEQIVEDAPEQVIQLLAFLKGNFFLLKNISPTLLEKINTIIEQHKKEAKNEYFTLFDVFEFSDIFFDDISEEIDEFLIDIERRYNEEKSRNHSYFSAINY